MIKFKDILISVGFLAIVITIGVAVIFLLGGLSMGIQWLWKQIPFGISGFALGSVIIAITVFMARQIMPERKFKLSWDFLDELGVLEIIGYLLGCVLIFASILWFVTPYHVLRVLPSFGTVLTFLLIGTLIFFGAAACLAQGISAWRIYVLGSLFYFACGVFGVWVVNSIIWSYTEVLPSDYYMFGKAIFAFLLLLQMIYILLFHVLPAIRQNKKESRKDAEKLNKKDESS